jgi:hypothetical protein
MPVTLSRGDRRLLLSAGAVFVLLTLVGALLGTGQGDERPTTYSAASGGAKAVYLLLQASGYRVDRWQQPVEELPRDGQTTLILAEPIQTPSDVDRKAIDAFMSAGGRVIATGDIGASFLRASVKRDPIAGLTWAHIPAVAPSAITKAAPWITIAPQNAWSRVQFGVPLYATDDAYVVRIPHGAGEAIWWASSTPLSNAGVREPGNLEFFLACIGPPSRGRVLFDEYVHGHRRTLVASIWNSAAKWALVQFAILAALLIATHSRRSGPIIVPAAESRLSPLEFVRTLGSLYARAGAASVAVDMAFQRFRYRLTRRFGIAPNAAIDHIERAVAARAPAEAATLASTLRACDAARNTRKLDPKKALALVTSLGEIATKLRLFGKETR